ncbi:MAG: DUF2332 family protein [Opitutales bacterium]
MHPTLHLTSFKNGKKQDQPLARTDGHGRWIEWLASGGMSRQQKAGFSSTRIRSRLHWSQ